MNCPFTPFSFPFIRFSSLLNCQEPLHCSALQQKNHQFILEIGGDTGGVPGEGRWRNALSSALTRFSSRFIAFSSLLNRQELLHRNALQRKNHPFIHWIGLGHRGVPGAGDQRSALSSPPRPWWGSSSSCWPLGVRHQAMPALRISPRLRSQVRLLRTEPS
jgi:hypothetical protein